MKTLNQNFFLLDYLFNIICNHTIDCNQRCAINGVIWKLLAVL